MNQSEEQLTVRIREATEADAPFIFSSWLKSSRQSEPWSFCENAVYFQEHHKLIEKLLKRCKTFVACDPSDPGTIYGYTCFETVDSVLVLHYVYVKHTFRQLGVARELLKECKHDFKSNAALFTHWTKAGRSIAPRYNLVFHPYILINYSNGG